MFILFLNYIKKYTLLTIFNYNIGTDYFNLKFIHNLCPAIWN